MSFRTRSIATLLSAILFSQSAFDALAMQSTLPSRQLFPQSNSNILPRQISKYVRIQSPHKSTNKPVVYLLQDIHLNEEAQKNAAEALNLIADAHKSRPFTVAIEGSVGTYDYSQYRRFDSKRVKAAANQFVKDGRIGALAYAGITTPLGAQKQLRMQGLETPALYLENVEAYRKALSATSTAEGWLAKEATKIAKASLSFRPLVQDFLEHRRTYVSGKTSTGEYAQYLASLLPDEKVPLELEIFIEANRLEKSILFPRVEKERTEIIFRLSGQLTKSELVLMNDWVADQKSGALRLAEFYRQLGTLLAAHNISLKPYPAYSDYVRYVSISDGIAVDNIFDDVRTVEAAFIEQLKPTQLEKKVLDDDRWVSLARKLTRFALSPEEWQEYTKTTAQRPTSLRPFELFYEVADRRTTAMIDNLNVAGGNTVIFAGGYHTPGFKKILEARGFAPVVLTPIITRVKNAQGAEYLRIFLREKSPLQKLFEGRTLFLAPTEVLGAQNLDLMSADAIPALRRDVPSQFATACAAVSDGDGAVVHYSPIQASIHSDIVRRAEEKVPSGSSDHQLIAEYAITFFYGRILDVLRSRGNFEVSNGSEKFKVNLDAKHDVSGKVALRIHNGPSDAEKDLIGEITFLPDPDGKLDAKNLPVSIEMAVKTPASDHRIESVLRAISQILTDGKVLMNLDLCAVLQQTASTQDGVAKKYPAAPHSVVYNLLILLGAPPNLKVKILGLLSIPFEVLFVRWMFELLDSSLWFQIGFMCGWSLFDFLLAYYGHKVHGVSIPIRPLLFLRHILLSAGYLQVFPFIMFSPWIVYSKLFWTVVGFQACLDAGLLFWEQLINLGVVVPRLTHDPESDEFFIDGMLYQSNRIIFNDVEFQRLPDERPPLAPDFKGMTGSQYRQGCKVWDRLLTIFITRVAKEIEGVDPGEIVHELSKNIAVAGYFLPTRLLIGQLMPSRYRWGMLRISRGRPVLAVPFEAFCAIDSESDYQMMAFALIFAVEWQKKYKELKEIYGDRHPEIIHEEMTKFEKEWNEKEKPFRTWSFRVRNVFRYLADLQALIQLNSRLGRQFRQIQRDSAWVLPIIHAIARKYSAAGSVPLDRTQTKIIYSDKYRNTLDTTRARIMRVVDQAVVFGEYELALPMIQWSNYVCIVDTGMMPMHGLLTAMRVLLRTRRYGELKELLENLKNGEFPYLIDQPNYFSVRHYWKTWKYLWARGVRRGLRYLIHGDQFIYRVPIDWTELGTFFLLADNANFREELDKTLARQAEIVRDDRNRTIIVEARKVCVPLYDQIKAKYEQASLDDQKKSQGSLGKGPSREKQPALSKLTNQQYQQLKSAFEQLKMKVGEARDRLSAGPGGEREQVDQVIAKLESFFARSDTGELAFGTFSAIVNSPDDFLLAYATPDSIGLFDEAFTDDFLPYLDEILLHEGFSATFGERTYEEHRNLKNGLQRKIFDELNPLGVLIRYRINEPIHVAARAHEREQQEPLDEKLKDRLEDDIWLWVFDKDDSLTPPLTNIEPETVKLLDSVSEYNPDVDMGIITGMGIVNLDKQVTDRLTDRLKSVMYAYSAVGGHAFRPNQDRSTTPIFYRPLSALGKMDGRLDQSIRDAMALAAPELPQHGREFLMPDRRLTKITIEMPKATDEARAYFCEMLRRVLKERGYPSQLRVAATSVAVEVSMVDKAEALTDLAERVAKKRGATLEDVLRHTVVIGDSEIDVSMLNLVAEGGGTAIWVGRRGFVGLHDEVHRMLPVGPASTRQALTCHLNWLDQIDTTAKRLTNHQELNQDKFKITNKEASDWIQEMHKFTEADDYQVIDESDDDRLLDEGVAAGELERLPHNNFYARSHPDDVARVISRTFVATTDPNDKGEYNNWRDTKEIRSQVEKRIEDSMKGQRMYVIPYLMGPADSPFSQVGVQVTNSRYVALNMIRMTRVGKPAIERLNRGERFVKAIHSTGDLDKIYRSKDPNDPNDDRYFVNFPEERLIMSFGSGYGGNALLAKKSHALRQANYDAVKEGWLAEHMLIVGVEDLQTKETTYIAAAFPSASGKTNLAMLTPPDELKDRYRIWLVGDDIAWLRQGSDGRLWAINPENGFFGVAPGTNEETNPIAMQAIGPNTKTIFTNVAFNKKTGEVWWEGKTPKPPEDLDGWYDWKGKPVTKETKQWAHPNSRFTTQAKNAPSYREATGEGVPISAILFGGRVYDLESLVRELPDAETAIYDGAMMGVAGTAAAKTADFVEDPFAMAAFFGTNLRSYYRNWFNVMQRLGSKAPKFFHVNWFRKNANGKFIWPGYGQNLRVLLWIMARAAGRTTGDGAGEQTPVGVIPTADAINKEGLKLSESDLEEARRYKHESWVKEMPRRKAYIEKLGSEILPEMRETNTKTELAISEYSGAPSPDEMRAGLLNLDPKIARDTLLRMKPIFETSGQNYAIAELMREPEILANLSRKEVRESPYDKEISQLYEDIFFPHLMGEPLSMDLKQDDETREGLRILTKFANSTAEIDRKDPDVKWLAERLKDDAWHLVPEGQEVDVTIERLQWLRDIYVEYEQVRKDAKVPPSFTFDTLWNIYMPDTEWTLKDREIKAKEAGQPLETFTYVQSVIIAQGGGKSTMDLFLPVVMKGKGINYLSFGVDEYYKDHEEMIDLKNTEHPAFAMGRGLPGSHDIKDLDQTVRDIVSANPEARVFQYDKSLFDGAGGRKASIKPVLPVQVLRVNTWLGGPPLSPEALAAIPRSAQDVYEDQHFIDKQGRTFRTYVNDRMGSYYDAIQRNAHSRVMFRDVDYDNVAVRRVIQEKKLIEDKGSGMSVPQTLSMIGRFVRSNGIYDGGAEEEADVVYELGANFKTKPKRIRAVGENKGVWVTGNSDLNAYLLNFTPTNPYENFVYASMWATRAMRESYHYVLALVLDMKIEGTWRESIERGFVNAFAKNKFQATVFLLGDSILTLGFSALCFACIDISSVQGLERLVFLLVGLWFFWNGTWEARGDFKTMAQVWSGALQLPQWLIGRTGDAPKKNLKDELAQFESKVLALSSPIDRLDLILPHLLVLDETGRSLDLNSSEERRKFTQPEMDRPEAVRAWAFAWRSRLLLFKLLVDLPHADRERLFRIAIQFARKHRIPEGSLVSVLAEISQAYWELRRRMMSKEEAGLVGQYGMIVSAAGYSNYIAEARTLVPDGKARSARSSGRAGAKVVYFMAPSFWKEGGWKTFDYGDKPGSSKYWQEGFPREGWESLPGGYLDSLGRLKTSSHLRAYYEQLDARGEISLCEIPVELPRVQPLGLDDLGDSILRLEKGSPYKNGLNIIEISDEANLKEARRLIRRIGRGSGTPASVRHIFVAENENLQQKLKRSLATFGVQAAVLLKSDVGHPEGGTDIARVIERALSRDTPLTRFARSFSPSTQIRIYASQDRWRMSPLALINGKTIQMFRMDIRLSFAGHVLELLSATGGTNNINSRMVIFFQQVRARLSAA